MTNIKINLFGGNGQRTIEIQPKGGFQTRHIKKAALAETPPAIITPDLPKTQPSASVVGDVSRAFAIRKVKARFPRTNPPAIPTRCPRALKRKRQRQRKRQMRRFWHLCLRIPFIAVRSLLTTSLTLWRKCNSSDVKMGTKICISLSIRL